MASSKNSTKSDVKFTDPVICYPGHIDKCSKISKTARNILDIILVIMNIHNQVYLDAETISIIRRMTLMYYGKSYTIQTVRNVIHELTSTQILLKHEKKNYFINPIYFMKFSPEERRRKLITDLAKEGVIRISNSE